jgi:hypothetical protein
MSVQSFREGWMQMFEQRRSPNMFLQRFFTLKPGGASNSKMVALDIQRFGEAVAVVVARGSGVNFNDLDIFTTKEFEPPQYGEGVSFDVNDLLERMVGVDPFSAAARPYAAQLMAYMVKGYSVINDKIVRGVELQAAQILQTGKLSLTDKDDAVRFDLDFKPKATHFPTVGTNWSNGASDKINDLGSLAEVIRKDGKVEPDVIILGRSALRNLLKDTSVKEFLDNRRYEVGTIAPQISARSGATRYGRITVDTYEFELWTYPDTYDHPNTGAPTKYIADDKVVMLSTQTRLDRVSARVPHPIGPDPRIASIMPGRLTSTAAGGNFDVTPNLYCTPNGKQVIGELESRTLLLPVQIDGFGCLDTEI